MVPRTVPNAQVDGKSHLTNRRNRERNDDRSALRALRTTRALPARRMGGRSRDEPRRELLVARPAGAGRRPPDRVHVDRHGRHGAAIASALRGWEHLRYEVTEEPTSASDGGRWMHTPDLGVFYAQTDVTGNMVVPRTVSATPWRSPAATRSNSPRAASGARPGLGRRARAVPPRRRGQPRRLAPPRRLIRPRASSASSNAARPVPGGVRRPRGPRVSAPRTDCGVGPAKVSGCPSSCALRVSCGAARVSCGAVESRDGADRVSCGAAESRAQRQVFVPRSTRLVAHPSLAPPAARAQTGHGTSGGPPRRRGRASRPVRTRPARRARPARADVATRCGTRQRRVSAEAERVAHREQVAVGSCAARAPRPSRSPGPGR